MVIVKPGDLVVLSMPIGHTGEKKIQDFYDEALRGFLDSPDMKSMPIKVIGFPFGPMDSVPTVLFVQRPEPTKTCLCD